jgi:hypothetical protein
MALSRPKAYSVSCPKSANKRTFRELQGKVEIFEEVALHQLLVDLGEVDLWGLLDAGRAWVPIQASTTQFVSSRLNMPTRTSVTTGPSSRR